MPYMAIFLISLTVGIKAVYDNGLAQNIEDWDDSKEASELLIMDGRLRLKGFRTVAWNLPKEARKNHLIFHLEMGSDWIGQIFFSTGGQEIFLIYQDAREYVGKGLFTVELLAKDGKLTGEIMNGKELPTSSSYSGPIEKLQIRSSQSDFYIESITVIDPETGDKLAYENFGPNFSLLNILCFTLLIFIILALFMTFDITIFHKIFHRDKRELSSSFITACLPFPMAYLFLSKENLDIVFNNLLFACLIYRIILAMLFSRKRVYQIIPLVIAVLAGTLFIVLVVDELKIFSTNIGLILFGVSLPVFSLSVLLLFKKDIGKRDSEALLLKLWLFPALANIFINSKMDNDDILALSSIALLSSVISAFRFLFPLRKELRFFQIYAFITAILLIATIEMAIRVSPYEPRYRPMNIGKIYNPDSLLFWAPKSLFLDINPLSPEDDFEVREISFRSGTTDKTRKKDQFRILTLGGSNTWGQWIEDHRRTWSGILERELAEKTSKIEFEVINGGVKGYNLFQLLVLYKFFLKDYEIDMIILYVNTNDRAASHKKGMYTYRELFNLRNSDKWKEITGDNKEAGEDKPVSWVADIQEKMGKFTLYNALTKSLLAIRSKVNNPKTNLGIIKSLNPVEDYAKNLREFAKIAQERAIPIIFADEYSFSTTPHEDLKADKFQETMMETAKQKRVLFFPACWILQKNFNPVEIVFPWDTVHLNEKGHRVLGEKLAELIIKENLI